MNFEDRINKGINRTKLEAATELSKRDCRYKDILSIVLMHCDKVKFIDIRDKEDRTIKFEWLCKIVDIHLTSIMLADQIYGNDIPMDSAMIHEDNERKAQQIVESITLYLIAASPKFDLKDY